MKPVKLPLVFIIDRMERDLDCGAVVLKPRHAEVTANRSTLADILSDAEYYCHQDGPDAVSPGLKASARATVKALESHYSRS